MPRRKKPKPGERARIVFDFDDGRSLSKPLVEIALACIRQWVAMEKMDASTPDQARNRESARANLRRIAELAINSELHLAIVTEGGRKGGKRGSSSKAVPILAEAEKRATIGTGEIHAIASKTGACIRTVRDTLTEAGRYTPQKNGK